MLSANDVTCVRKELQWIANRRVRFSGKMRAVPEVEVGDDAVSAITIHQSRLWIVSSFDSAADY